MLSVSKNKKFYLHLAAIPVVIKMAEHFSKKKNIYGIFIIINHRSAHPSHHIPPTASTHF